MSHSTAKSSRPHTDATFLVSRHFAAAQQGWSKIAATLREEIQLLDDTALLASRPITRFILTWMREVTAFQKQFGELFGRTKRPPSADDFTAAVALSLEQFLAARR